MKQSEKKGKIGFASIHESDRDLDCLLRLPAQRICPADQGDSQDSTKDVGGESKATTEVPNKI